MIKLCAEFKCRTHIVHLSSSDALDSIQKAKKKGLPLTVETAQHFLFFDAEEIGDGQTQFKCAPPIREKENNQKLWKALKSGLIDFVATDHSPAPPAMKELESGDFMKAWGGIASLQFSLPALWTTAKEQDCTIEDMSQWLSENPAKLLSHTSLKKGRIEKGYDADLVVWSPEEEFVVKKQMIRFKHKITPYLNKTLVGEVKRTYLAGELVYSNGTFIEQRKGKLMTN